MQIPKNFTPGPWGADPDADGYGVHGGYCIRNDLGLVLAVTIGDVPSLREAEKANAALLALAPQMAAELLSLRADVTRLTASLAAAEAEAGRLRGDVVRAAEDMRLAAMEAALARLTPLNVPADWTEYARTRAEAAGQVAAAILKVPLPQVAS